MTFKEYVEYMWVPNLRRRNVKPSTLGSYASMLDNHVYPFWAGKNLAEINPVQVEELLGSMKLYSPKYQKNVALLIRAAFNYAVESEILDKCPVRDNHMPIVADKEKPIWTENQIGQILDALSPEYRPPFEVAALTGMRVGEILGLTWGAVDFNRGWISVKRSLWNGHMMDSTKTRSIRVLPMGPELYVYLKTHQEKEQSRWGETTDPWGRKHKMAELRPDDFVFRNCHGKPYSPDVLRRDVLYPTLARLGMTWGKREAGFHRFRHSAGSIVVSKTGNLKLAQKMLGHRSISTTANIYTHVQNDEIKRAAEVLEQSILDSPKVVELTQPSTTTSGDNYKESLVAGAGFEPATFGL